MDNSTFVMLCDVVWTTRKCCRHDDHCMAPLRMLDPDIGRFVGRVLISLSEFKRCVLITEIGNDYVTFFMNLLITAKQFVKKSTEYDFVFFCYYDFNLWKQQANYFTCSRFSLLSVSRESVVVCIFNFTQKLRIIMKTKNLVP